MLRSLVIFDYVGFMEYGVAGCVGWHYDTEQYCFPQG